MDDELQTTNALLESWPALTPEERLEAFERIPRAEIDDFFLDLPAARSGRPHPGIAGS